MFWKAIIGLLFVSAALAAAKDVSRARMLSKLSLDELRHFMEKEAEIAANVAEEPSLKAEKKRKADEEYQNLLYDRMALQPKAEIEAAVREGRRYVRVWVSAAETVAVARWAKQRNYSVSRVKEGYRGDVLLSVTNLRR